MRRPQRVLAPPHLLLVLLGVAHALPERPTCANVKNGIGHTLPAGDIFLQHGVDALDLECIITDPRILRAEPRASDALRFMNGTALLNDTTIEDGSRIRLHVDADRLGIGSPAYECMYHNEIVCSNVVFVATPPRPADFRCISLNNDNLTCSWTHPRNSIENNYTLFYTVQNQPRMKNHCPDNRPEYDPVAERYFCTWTLSTNPQYRQSSPYYNITFAAANRLGAAAPLRLHFNHFAHIIPNAPERLEVRNATTSSLLLRWGVPPTIQHRWLEYRVMYTCGLELPERVRMRGFQLAAVGRTKDHAWRTFNLTGLPYAHDLCDVRVALRINETRADDMWSANATLYARTAAAVPGEGPRVNVGSFKHINDTAVRIYWRQVPVEYENGRNLRYNVTLVRGAGGVVIDRARALKNSVVVANLAANQEYTFAVHASNDVGAQRAPPALITIPARHQRPYQVRELKKIEHARGFKLRWEPRARSSHHVDVASYTVFWCREITKSFNEDCNGNWDWATLPADRKEYAYTDRTADANDSTSFRVAIASNAPDASSGMFFPTCEESGEQIPTVNLIKPTRFGDTSVTLSWMVKCTTEGIANYTIEYCIGDQASYDCRNKRKLRADVDGGATEFAVGNLTPYSTYLFTIYPTMRNGGKGRTSDPERVTTLEGTPSEPLQLEAPLVGNASVALRWRRPLILNGYILYKVVANGREAKADLKETSYVLDNLRSYVWYNISVMACTTKCSQPAEIRVRTLMGTPGRVGQPTATAINASDVLIVWARPAEPRGPLAYEVRVDDGDVRVYANASEHFHYRCTHKTAKFSIAVRGVNVDAARNRTYYGDWSDEFRGNCAPGVGWLIPLLVVLGATMVGTAFVGSRKLYSRCRKMQDIDVKLPATLIASDHPSSWPSPSDPNLRDARPARPPPAADEELLLQSRPEGGGGKAYAGDSSGCSSAQGSVTSESEGTFSAASDSGTEQGELRKRSFRNSSKASLLGAEAGGGVALAGTKGGETYAQVGMGAGMGMVIETNPLAEMDDAPYADAAPPSAASAYVTVAQARSLPKPKEEPVVSKPYVQVADLKAAAAVAAAQKREAPTADAARSYVTVGQLPPVSKMGKLYDAKLLKED